MRRRVLAGAAAVLVMASVGWADTAAPKMQQAADLKAYRAARETKDPAKKLEALQAFKTNFPDSKYVSSANTAILSTELDHFPEREKDIAGQMKLVMQGLKKSFGKTELYWELEAQYAEQLADARDEQGVDLKLAKKMTNDAASHLEEAKFDDLEQKQAKKYKQPAPKPDEMHHSYARTYPAVLTAQAQLDLDTNQLPAAQTALDQAYGLDPLNGDVSEERGVLALKQNNDAGALAAFERADLLGNLTEAHRKKLAALYAAAHGGSMDGFDGALDKQYAGLYPADFVPVKQTPATVGHTALLELFTGSGCEWCPAGDVAVDAMIDTYPRKDLVALVFDQHIPAPDPLANEDSLDRAKEYGIGGTPSYTLDGKQLPQSGAYREDAKKNIYDPMLKEVQTAIAVPTDVRLKLTAERGADGAVKAVADVTTGSEAALGKEIVFAPEAKPKTDAKADAKGKSAVAKPAVAVVPAAPPKPDLVVNFALVEDDIRYSGENGVRFHRYVVRATAKPAGEGYPVAADKTASFDASFDPTKISAKLHDYLAGYQKDNGNTFLMMDTAIDAKKLYVAAWVQDKGTHRVLDAALVPVADGTGNVTAAGAN